MPRSSAVGASLSKRKVTDTNLYTGRSADEALSGLRCLSKALAVLPRARSGVAARSYYGVGAGAAHALHGASAERSSSSPPASLNPK
ncbi:hypothetical protein EVAR_86011_1 [Eumeta japonica]|uniref:Uncharacterized protein n=1 Tax=Eumeta variegata TaxID=151549 RepID=A0A4C1UJK7_EUMVA|nr:hypothetical protein EVAR_86011_1 [Eumeta japonica]